MKNFFLIISVALILPVTSAVAQADGENASNSEEKASPTGVKTGIEGKKAPPLGVTDWIQLPEGEDQFDTKILGGKVVVLFLWQSTCEACEKREFPVLQKLVKEFEGEKEIIFLAIQTPFENYTSNSELRLKPTAEKFDLKIPFGHLAKTKDQYSINVAYETGGTPWWVVIDKEGIVEFNGYTMDPEIGIANLKKLIAGEEIPD